MRGLAFCMWAAALCLNIMSMVFCSLGSLFLVFNIFCVLSFFNAERSTIIPYKKWHEFQTIFPTL